MNFYKLKREVSGVFLLWMYFEEIRKIRRNNKTLESMRHPAHLSNIKKYSSYRKQNTTRKM